MKFVDVAIQSYKKPESLIYTLFSLKKYCSDLVETVYINDDCSGGEVVSKYLDANLQEMLKPLKIKVRINEKPSKYSSTIMTKTLFKKKPFIQKFQLILGSIIKHDGFKLVKWHKTEDDIRYQWAINQTDKRYLFIIHDDIKFFDDVLKIYYDKMLKDDNFAIIGDLGGERLCPYGPCGEEHHCSPKKILNGEFPCDNWPRMGTKSFMHRMLGRSIRGCRINEWCCLINVEVAKKLVEDEGVCFGNYERGGDVATYWLERIIKRGYKFYDPIPVFSERKNFYLHWWQGHEGHEVWVDYGNGKAQYQSDYIKQCIKDEFGYIVK